MVAESEAMVAAEPHTAAVQVSPTAVIVAADEVNVNDPKKNRIQVSNTKKPLFFYLNLAKRYIKQYNDVELTALGMAIPTAVTIAEILKANGIAVEKKVLMSTVGTKDENKGRLVQKAKLEIVLEKSEKSANQAQKKIESQAVSEPKTLTITTTEPEEKIPQAQAQ